MKTAAGGKRPELVEHAERIPEQRLFRDLSVRQPEDGDSFDLDGLARGLQAEDLIPVRAPASPIGDHVVVYGKHLFHAEVQVGETRCGRREPSLSCLRARPHPGAGRVVVSEVGSVKLVDESHSYSVPIGPSLLVLADGFRRRMLPGASLPGFNVHPRPSMWRH